MLAQMVRPPSGSATPPSDGVGRSRRETHPGPKRARVRPVFLLAGLVAAPLAWIIQICTSEALASHACFPMGHPLSAPELTSLLRLVATVSAACFCARYRWVWWRHGRVGGRSEANVPTLQQVCRSVDDARDFSRWSASSAVRSSCSDCC